MREEKIKHHSFRLSVMSSEITEGGGREDTHAIQKVTLAGFEKGEGGLFQLGIDYIFSTEQFC